AVVLDEHAPCVGALGTDVGVDLVGRRLPAVSDRRFVAQASQARSTVGGHPAQQLRGGEVLGLAADLPHAAVGLAPMRQGVFDLPLQDGPQALGKVVAGLGVEVHR